MPAPVTSSLFSPSIPALPAATASSEAVVGSAFGDLLQQAVARGATMQSEADLAVMQALSGGDITQVEVLSAVKKADLALRMMLQVRNKLLDAYNEIQQIRF